MAKFIFKVYDRVNHEQIAQVIANNDEMLDTIRLLNELGMVKAFILDDKEKENDN